MRNFLFSLAVASAIASVTSASAASWQHVAPKGRDYCVPAVVGMFTVWFNTSNSNGGVIPLEPTNEHGGQIKFCQRAVGSSK